MEDYSISSLQLQLCYYASFGLEDVKISKVVRLFRLRQNSICSHFATVVRPLSTRICFATKVTSLDSKKQDCHSRYYLRDRIRHHSELKSLKEVGATPSEGVVLAPRHLGELF